ncbi:MAG: bifunctional phosphopantothenoylcysteine decarboxylase/phosphopantothenate--cysteine ligase CoaBC, partial [Ignavibacteriales bacterium]|nr:bifunctional phosphopantothenoylcysteine decarboxylase/phosphopantothenate--cysteine ligase CoaBC [Ignavibacteriales bacterium]
FVTPLTLSTLSQSEVIVGSFPRPNSGSLQASTRHIDLAQWADLMLIAPATANTLAKLAHGYTDNAVTTLAIAMRGPVVLSPSMDVDMFRHPSTQANITALRELGYYVLEPEHGVLASGLVGQGRLPNLPKIQKALDNILNYIHQDFKGKKILITAGPTYEPIDPVRFIGNRSSGKMGFALANAAAQRGAEVILISGNVHLQTPRHVQRYNVQTAKEMFTVVMKHRKNKDAIIMAAAVADFTPLKPASNKIKKESSDTPTFTIELRKTKDILQHIGEKKGKCILAGFALETEDGVANAKKKLKEKRLDLIVLNNPMEEGAGFETDTNIVTIISKTGKIERLKKMPKFEVANIILNKLSKLI